MARGWKLALVIFVAQVSYAQTPQPEELVRAAVANHNARTAQASEYEYQERNHTTLTNNVGGKRTSFDVYENMAIEGHLYRRHIEHNGQPIPPEDEAQERERFAAEEKAKSDAILRAGVANGHRVFGSWAVGNELPQLSLKNFPYFFDFRVVKEEMLEGRTTWVVEAKPKHGQRPTDEVEDDIRTFKIKLWIDQAEKQLIRVEAKAIHRGMLGYAVYATMDPKLFPYPDQVAQAFSKIAIMYSRGTVIIMEWRKIDNAVWLPIRKQVKGTRIECFPRNMPVGAEVLGGGEIEEPIESETVYSDYKKFGVTHRIIMPDSH